MRIAFTLCSNNYLAQAKTLGDSLKQSNPDYLFFIGLNDIFCNEIDYGYDIGHHIILTTEIGIPNFDNLWKKYSIIELNTCVKPFFFQYFFSKYNSVEYVLYFDPDIYIYQNLNNIENEFEKGVETLLTPHILSPIGFDNKTPGENLFLNYGIFNLGFLGLRNSDLVFEFLEWWKERTYNLGFNQPEKGLFVDQLWFNLVPIFFKNVQISKHPGLNMAPWNLHERILIDNNSLLFMNESFPLVFYHFSNYKYTSPDCLSNVYNRYNFETNFYLKSIYLKYNGLLIINGIQKLSKIPCYYMVLRQEYYEEELRKKLKSSNIILIKHLLKKIIPPKGIRILKAIIY